MAGVDVSNETSVRARFVPAVRIGLAVVWLVWAVAAWWTAPRASTTEQLRADIAAERVDAYQWADSFSDADTGGLWFTRVRLTLGSDEPGRLVVWRTGFGRVHYAEVPVGASADDPNPPPYAEANNLDALLRRGTGPASHGSVMPSFPPILAAALALVCLGILLQGPAPGLGTRWFWFFLGALPFGLGVLLWLAAERPWTQPAAPAPDRKTGQPKRYSGLTGLALLIVGGIVISIAVAVLRNLPEWLVPSGLS